MELYSTYPKFVTFWCCLETVIFAGQLFGWSCLLYILKTEGFYDYTCPTDTSHHDEQNPTNKYNNQSTLRTGVHVYGENVSDTYANGYINGVNEYEANLGDYQITTRGVLGITEAFREKEPVALTCLEQDSRLNLWFSIAICFSYAMCVVLGPFLQKVGMRYFRIVLVFTYVVGALCLAFATKVTPWLICPGLCLIGVSGMALYSTNIQMSFLFPRVQSTITSLFVGLYDASTVVTQLVKTGFEHGLERKHSFIILACLHVLLVGTSTMFFLPSVHVSRRTKHANKQGTKAVDEKHVTNNSNVIRAPDVVHKKSLARTIVSGQYMLHVYWMCVQAVRFVTFLGFLNAWLVSKFHGDRQKESQFLSAFSYITMGTVISAITAGMLHDCERKRYQSSDSYRSKKMPIVVPLVVTTFLSILTTSLMYIETDGVLYLIFILFTVYRSYLFSFEVTFLNDVFPLEYFAVLFGVLHSSAGLAGMIQHPLFEWYRSYQGAPLHINMFLIGLELSSLVHPCYIWYQCRHQRQMRKEDIGLIDRLTVHV